MKILCIVHGFLTWAALMLICLWLSFELPDSKHRETVLLSGWITTILLGIWHEQMRRLLDKRRQAKGEKDRLAANMGGGDTGM